MNNKKVIIDEPSEAFPYTPPSDEIKENFAHIFLIEELSPRILKTIFDRFLGLVLLTISLPILFILKIAYLIEGFLIPENKGPMLFYYWGVSGGKKIKKWKIRLIKQKFIDKEGALRHDWIAFSAEWTTESRTFLGEFVKKWYLDELPQFWSVLIGDMSIVGPRPLVPEGESFYTESQSKLLRSVRPGVTGIGSLVLRDEESYYAHRQDSHEFYKNVISPYKALVEMWYVENKSIYVDLKIIILTALSIAVPNLKVSLYFKSLPGMPQELYDSREG